MNQQPVVSAVKDSFENSSPFIQQRHIWDRDNFYLKINVAHPHNVSLVKFVYAIHFES